MDCDSIRLVDCHHRLGWMRGKPVFVALLASGPVSAADECHALLQACAGEYPISVSLTPQNVKTWLRLYTKHRAVTKAVADVFLETLVAGLRGSDGDIAEFLVGDASVLGGVDFLNDALWRRAFERIEVRFLLRIVIPCLLIYGTSPAELLEPIGQGGPSEWENIGKLVALDPLVVGHSRIGRMLKCDDAKVCRQRTEMLGECLMKPPPRLSKRQVKMMLAALMSRLSECLGSRFTEPEIRGLFDAIAQDRQIGLRDPDLPESPEAFSKAIQRYRTFWQLPMVPDTKTLEAVRALEMLFS
jgi:hypothetical protein